MAQKRAPSITSDDEHIADMLHSFVCQRDMGQETIAESLGVKPQQVQKYLYGIDTIRASRLFALAHTLQVPIDTFFASCDTGTQHPELFADIQDILDAYTDAPATKRKFVQGMAELTLDCRGYDQPEQLDLTEVRAALQEISVPYGDGTPHPIDIHVGQRLKKLRDEKRLSQKAIGKVVKKNFQQVQKYERGVNRMSAGQIYLISQELGVQPSYFFDQLPADIPARIRTEPSADHGLMLAPQPLLNGKTLTPFAKDVHQLRLDDRNFLRHTLDIPEVAAA